jgi:LPXTG-motif cell wall-anchored protein
MKTTAHTTRGTIALLTLLSLVLLLGIGATPALADGLDAFRNGHMDQLRVVDPDQIRELLPALEELIPVAPEDADEADEGPFPDGGDWAPVPAFPEDEEIVPGDAGDWEPVFPDDEDEETVPSDDGEDEMVPDEPEDDADEEEETVPSDDGEDEMVPDEPEDDADEADEEAPEEAQPPEEPSDEQAATLPFTGGSNTPWFIAGIAVALAGAVLLFGRRDRSEER